MSAKRNISRIIGQHREKVAQLFEMYGVDLPLTVQNVWDVLYLKGDDFAKLFWSIDTVNFGGTTEDKSKPFFSTPEVKDNTFLVVFGVALIIVLVVIAFITRKKDA